MALFFAAILWLVPMSEAPNPPQDILAEAQRLRDDGDFAKAAELLQTEIAQWPADGEAARLLAQTLYWLKDFSGARSLYEAEVVRHPEDVTLRVQFGRMLAETGDRRRAREVLTPLLQASAVRAEAETLLGMLAYWEGDLTTARNLFLSAIHDNPNQEE